MDIKTYEDRNNDRLKDMDALFNVARALSNSNDKAGQILKLFLTEVQTRRLHSKYKWALVSIS